MAIPHTIQELLHHDYNKRLKKNRISLKLLAEFFQKKICTYFYSYKTNICDIELICLPENFCHLVGIQHIGDYLAKQNNRPNLAAAYKGATGWKNIIDEVHTLGSLKNIHKGIYNDIEDRIFYIPIMFQLLRQPEICQFNPLLVKGFSNLKADLIVYCDRANKRTIIRLNLAIRYEGTHFVPVSFMVMYEPKEDKYTKGQNNIVIEEILIKPDSPNELPYTFQRIVIESSEEAE